MPSQLSQAPFELDRVAVDPEAGPVEGDLWIQVFVDERGHELDVRLRLYEAAHDAERPEQPSFSQEHPGDDRVVRPTAGNDASGNCEARAAVLKDDAGAGRDDARPEAVVEALDQRDGHTVAVHGAEVHGATRELAHRRRRIPAASREEAGLQEIGDVGVVPHACERVSERETHALHPCRRRGLAQREQPKAFERGDPLRWRRQLADGRSSIVERERLDPARGVAREVLRVEPRGRCDCGSDVAPVDHVGPLARDPPQRRPELRKAHDAPDARRRKELRRRRRADPSVCGHRPDGESALCRRDRVLERGVEAEAAEALGERGPTGNGSGNRDGARAGLLDRALRVSAERGRPGSVEPVELLTVPDLCEEIAADARRHRLGDAQDRRRSEGCVHGVAAALERPQAGAGRERLTGRHHRLGGDRRRPEGRRPGSHAAR